MLTLHVGPGTFLPVKSADPRDHKMHTEWGVLSPETARRIQATRRRRRAHCRGRYDEPAPARKCCRRDRRGAALCRRNPIVHSSRSPVPGHRPAADQLPPAALDSLHAGRGLAGYERIKAAYAHAIAAGYRFFFYGDACLIERR